MKTNLLPLGLLLVAVSTFTSGSAFAHADGHSHAPAKPPIATETLPSTMAGTLTAIQNQLARLKTAQKDGKFNAVAAHAVTLNHLVKHFAGQAPSERKTQAKEIADQNAAITAELTRAAAAGAAKPVSDLVSKLSANLRALQLFES